MFMSKNALTLANCLIYGTRNFDVEFQKLYSFSSFKSTQLKNNLNKNYEGLVNLTLILGSYYVI